MQLLSGARTAGGGLRRDERTPALLAANAPLGLEPGVDRADRVDVHARDVGKLPDAWESVPRDEGAVLDRRPDAASQLRTQRGTSPAVDAEIELTLHAGMVAHCVAKVPVL